MIDNNFSSILNDIGQYIFDTFGGNTATAFLYAEAERAWQTVSVIGEVNGELIYRFANDDLVDAIDRLWEAAADDKKWTVLEYSMSGGAFDAEFTFPEDLDDEESHIERRERSFEKRFGSRQIIYPKLDGEPS